MKVNAANHKITLLVMGIKIGIGIDIGGAVGNSTPKFDYFIDQINGIDANDGLTPATAWQTIAKVNASSFVAGDRIGLKAGDTWKETLTVPSNGEEGNPIVIGKYGSGAKPILNGSDIITGWTPENITGISLAADANLQGYFKFDNDWLDSSGKGNNLTATGGPATFENTDVQQGTHAANFIAATSDKSTITDALLSASFPGKNGTTITDMTIGCRVKFNSILIKPMAIFNKGYQGIGYGLRLDASQKLSLVIILDAAIQVGIISNSIIGKDIWYNAVARVDSATKIVNLFINGIKQTAHYDATSTVLPAPVSDLRIGFESSLAYLDGKTDEVFFFNKALSDAEIFGIYAHGVDGTRNNYTAYYKDGLTYNLTGYAFEDGVAMSESGPNYKQSRLSDVDLSKQTMPQRGLWWDIATPRLYIRCSGDADPATKTIEVAQRQTCLFGHKNYITIQDIQCEKSSFYGINTLGIGNIVQRNAIVNIRAYASNYSPGRGQGIINMGGNGTIITGNDVSLCDWGINNSATESVDGVHVYNNHVYNIGADGIQILAGIGKTYSNVLIELNRVHDVGLFREGGVGIIWSGPSGGTQGNSSGIGNIARYNITYNNGLFDQGIGIGIQGSPTASIRIYYNLIYGIYGTCVMIGGGIGHIVYNNTCHGRLGKIYSNTGIQFALDAANCIVRNNIFYASEGTTILQGLVGAVTGHTIDYNTYYGGGATPFYWAGNKSFAAYKTASSQDANSVNNDPLFTDLAGLDFTLQAGSPSKDTGVDVSLIRDILGNPIVGLPDMGCYEKQ